MHLLRYEEWQGAGGYWHCNDTSDLKNNSSAWYHPARMLGISPVDFVKLLIERFQPDHIKFYQEANVLTYSWKSQAKMRLYKNWLNAEARKRNYRI